MPASLWQGIDLVEPVIVNPAIRRRDFALAGSQGCQRHTKAGVRIPVSPWVWRLCYGAFRGTNTWDGLGGEHTEMDFYPADHAGGANRAGAAGGDRMGRDC